MDYHDFSFLENNYEHYTNLVSEDTHCNALYLAKLDR